MAGPAAGDPIKAGDFPATLWVQDNTNINNISDTSPVVSDTGIPEVGGTFIAPTSGVVLVIAGGSGRGAGDRVAVIPQVFEGDDDSGTEVLEPNELSRGWVAGSSTTFTAGSRVTRLQGLTPLATHYARVVYQTSNGAGTADLVRREIIITPVW